MCHEIPATKVMQFLNELYSRLGESTTLYELPFWYKLHRDCSIQGTCY